VCLANSIIWQYSYSGNSRTVATRPYYSTTGTKYWIGTKTPARLVARVPSFLDGRVRTKDAHQTDRFWRRLLVNAWRKRLSRNPSGNFTPSPLSRGRGVVFEKRFFFVAPWQLFCRFFVFLRLCIYFRRAKIILTIQSDTRKSLWRTVDSRITTCVI